jgi:hypothetical protein
MEELTRELIAAIKELSAVVAAVAVLSSKDTDCPADSMQFYDLNRKGAYRNCSFLTGQHFRKGKKFAHRPKVDEDVF